MDSAHGIGVCGAWGDEAKRQSLQVELDALQAFKARCKRLPVGVSMQDAASQLLRWFSKQPEIVVTVALANIDEGMEGPYAAALRKMADVIEHRDHKPLTHPGAVKKGGKVTPLP
jgi:hypothetical protein